MAFKSIHTTQGLQIIAQAEATGTQIRLTHMAVGDGNGNPVEPNQGQTSLARERFRATVNRIYPNPEIPTMFTAELIIPATEGGFVLREVGVFDSNGNLIIVGNLPDTYKPTEGDGVFSDTVIRIPFMVTNADIVELKIDPNVVVATQSWIINNINPAVLFPGGTTGQILRKKSNADGDTEWGDPSDVNIQVDVIEERQTLAASQTDVTLSVVTTRGLAIYIEGVRIPQGAGADEWQPLAANPDTVVKLGKSYPAGTRILLTQNEPAGSVPFPLIRDQNLADVPDKLLARQNLEIYSKAETDQKAPAGMVAYFARNTAPNGWIKANGATISRTAYAELFAAIGTTFGSGDGFNTFRLPDLRGEFIRGWADNRTVDSGRVFGSSQGDAIRNITGNAPGGSAARVPESSYNGAFAMSEVASGRVSSGENFGLLTANFDASRVVPTANENRPRNVALLACIKY